MRRPTRAAVLCIAVAIAAACERPENGDAALVADSALVAESALDSSALHEVDYMNQFSETGFARLGEKRVQPEGDLAVELVAMATGNVDEDPVEEGAVVFSTTAGGTGVFLNLALVDVRSGSPKNVATLFLGDRIRVHSIEVADGEIQLDATVHTPADPSCCPTLRVVRRFVWADGTLREVDFPADALQYDPPMGEPPGATP